MAQDVKTICVKDIMTKNVITIDSTVSVNQISKVILNQENFLILAKSQTFPLMEQRNNLILSSTLLYHLWFFSRVPSIA